MFTATISNQLVPDLGSPLRLTIRSTRSNRFFFGPMPPLPMPKAKLPFLYRIACTEMVRVAKLTSKSSKAARTRIIWQLRYSPSRILNWRKTVFRFPWKGFLQLRHKKYKGMRITGESSFLDSSSEQAVIGLVCTVLRSLRLDRYRKYSLHFWLNFFLVSTFFTKSVKT